jgi:hypothetical protein
MVNQLLYFKQIINRHEKNIRIWRYEYKIRSYSHGREQKQIYNREYCQRKNQLDHYDGSYNISHTFT